MPAKASSPYSAESRSVRPRGSGSRIAATSTAKTIAASAKRNPAPQSGSSSRLLKRTATKFEPPISTATPNAPSASRSGARSAAGTAAVLLIGPIYGVSRSRC